VSAYAAPRTRPRLAAFRALAVAAHERRRLVHRLVAYTENEVAERTREEGASDRRGLRSGRNVVACTPEALAQLQRHQLVIPWTRVVAHADNLPGSRVVEKSSLSSAWRSITILEVPKPPPGISTPYPGLASPLEKAKAGQ
jgi:hypothetical protein